MNEPAHSIPEKENIWDEPLEQSLEVANFLDAIERIITRVFGVADKPLDNDDHPTNIPTEEE